MRLLNGIKQIGYSSQTNWVLSDMSEEEKEVELCYHSEKLAIAFGFLEFTSRKTNTYCQESKSLWRLFNPAQYQ